MTHNNQGSMTLSAALWPEAGTASRAWMRAGALAVAGTCLLTVSAKVQVPFWPVPMTLQTFVILLLGLCYGLRLGVATMTLYLGMGALGAPVFAAGGGIAYFTGPTGGYLAGFMVAMALMGAFGDRGWGRQVRTMIVPMVLGTGAILAFGVTWLAWLIGLDKALAAGLYPFLPAELAKLVVAVFLLPAVWRLVGDRDESA